MHGSEAALEGFFEALSRGKRAIEDPHSGEQYDVYDDEIGPPPRRVQFKEPPCRHLNVALRYVTIGHLRQYAHQCMQCGDQIDKFLSVAQVKDLGLTKGSSLSEFDETIAMEWRDYCAKMKSAYYDKQRKVFFEWYNKYLQTPRWKRIRELVIERDGNKCQGCRVLEINHVHHLTYEHVGCELLFELIGLCEGCHVRIHKKTTGVTDEVDLWLCG